jgi:hypothetical protein
MSYIAQGVRYIPDLDCAGDIRGPGCLEISYLGMAYSYRQCLAIAKASGSKRYEIRRRIGRLK